MLRNPDVSVQGRAGAGSRSQRNSITRPFAQKAGGRSPRRSGHRPALRCLSEGLCANTTLRVLLLDLEGAASQIKVPAVWRGEGAAPGAPSSLLV